MTTPRIVRVAALATLLVSIGATLAEARNPNCAGGIQYVTQAMRDKEKGNTEDYDREINKAVTVLQKCLTEDPTDYEAIGYLGWAYAEVESAGPAGKAFASAIQGLEGKGDKKKAEMMRQNMTAFYVRWFNDGVGKIRDAQQAYPEFCTEPKTDADKTLRAEAAQRFEEASTSLYKALQIRPGDTEAIRNIATLYAMQCKFVQAEAVVTQGLQAAPSDTALQKLQRQLRASMVGTMAEQNRFDDAIKSLNELIKSEPSNADHQVALAEILYRRAESQKGDAAKADFRAAGDAYAKASELKPAEGDLAFNGGVAYQNAQAWDKAEPMWAKAVKLRPEDANSLSSWGATLVELKRCPEAVQALHRAVDLKPQEKILHRQLGAIYTKCGNNPRATDELMVYLALEKGKPMADAAAEAKAAKQGSDAAKTLASDGVPDQIYEWEAESQKFKTWFYWTRKRAYAFEGGTLRHKSDWSTADAKSAKAASGGKS